MTELYIGLMSGTSLDGVDGVLADLRGGRLSILAHASAGFPIALRTELLALNTRGGADELHRAALAANGLAGIYAEVVQDLLRVSDRAPGDVRAIGAHGQTVRHRPGEFDDTGYTLQINNPSLLAERSGIAVVADFRSRDLAAGGQGAPLVPAFHRAIFGRTDQAIAVLNIGGISNLSLLPGGVAEGAAEGAADRKVLGFDCGPGNALMDHWCQAHVGTPYDAEGAWARTGRVIPRLMQRLQGERFFAKPPPKSTGRDLFNPAWLAAQLGSSPHAPQDVQATLTELTAAACAAELQRHAPTCRQLIVCGGGALNAYLMERLAALLPGVQVDSSAAHGLPPLQVEAAAFAWLAQAAIDNRPGNLTSVTGASGPRVLGAIYPA